MTAGGPAADGGSNQATYGYDNANRLTSVTDWNSNSTTYAYDDAGRMTTATLPSGTDIVSTYSYDNADRLTGITHVKGGSTTIASVAYTLDDVGNRTQRVDQQGTHTDQYDDLYRLTSVTYPGPSTTSYAFDAFGNRTSMTVAGNATTYAYDDNDRITTVTPPSPASVINYTWDDNGDLTARGSDSFSWDYEDRMVSATVNSVTTTFAYRGDGLRNSRTVGGNTTTFTWDIASGLPVVLDDGNQYVYGAGLTAQKQSGSWYYYLADGLGSTMAVVNASGVVQDSYTYDVYGTPTKTGSLANEFDFAGQQTDGTGLQYLRARYYDPATGTFLSREPMAAGTTWIGSAYGFAKGNSCRFTDPAGTWPVDGANGNDVSGVSPCFDLWLQIEALVNELNKREEDYGRDYFKLPEYDPDPNNNHGTRQGHREKYLERLADLQELLGTWADYDCDNPNRFPLVGDRGVIEDARQRVKSPSPLTAPSPRPIIPVVPPPPIWFEPVTPPEGWLPPGLCPVQPGGYVYCGY